tara:strand:+ start:503 stop:682 length:180 start_codon:yes stop_codon:yes gene_type:complete
MSILDMSMGLLSLTLVMLITNVLTVYFTFSAWYGKKKDKKMVQYLIDEDGKYHFDVDDR